MSTENAFARESFPPRTKREPETDHGHHDGNGADGSEPGSKLIRLKKPVVLRPDVGVRVDSTMVGPRDQLPPLKWTSQQDAVAVLRKVGIPEDWETGRPGDREQS